MSENILEINDSNFEQEVLTSNLPVIVDFWAPWCGPCRMLGPILENLAQQYNGKIKFVKLNVDIAPASAIRFNVQGIPTVIIFDKGNMVGQPLVGVKPAEEYTQIFDGLVGCDQSVCQINEGTSQPIDVNGTQDFANALKTDKLVIVDFRAPWCGPCRMLGPILEQISTEFAGKVQIVKINVDEESNQELANNFEVSGIPMVLLMKNSVMVDQFVGAQPYDAVKEIIQKNI